MVLLFHRPRFSLTSCMEMNRLLWMIQKQWRRQYAYDVSCFTWVSSRKILIHLSAFCAERIGRFETKSFSEFVASAVIFSKKSLNNLTPTFHNSITNIPVIEFYFNGSKSWSNFYRRFQIYFLDWRLLGLSRSPVTV